MASHNQYNRRLLQLFGNDYVVIYEIFVLVCLVVISSCYVTRFEIENYYFEGYFPRKISPSSMGGAQLPFVHDLVVDKYSWMIWDVTMQQNCLLYSHSMTSSQHDRMVRRIADNERWNKFVDYVINNRYKILVMMLLQVIIMGKLVLYGQKRYGRIILCTIIILSILIILELGHFVYRDYLGNIGN